MHREQIYDKVQEHYGSAARRTNDHEYGRSVATAFGYSEDELASIPQEANLGLSCGNPIALAKLKEGETVVDLGSGAGFDVFLAAKHVGASGKAIGVDMNKDMLEKANRNREKVQAKNIEFVESPITKIALSDATADCIISNCVINLVPEQEKQLVFNEIFRLLKPGGRVAVSDILTKRPLTQGLKDNMALYVGCISGASMVASYEEYLHQAGFKDVLIVDAKNDLNVYKSTDGSGQTMPCCGPKVDDTSTKQTTSCCGPKASTTTVDDAELERIDYNEWAGSFKIYAVKS